jgi:hypothetical protein
VEALVELSLPVPWADDFEFAVFLLVALGRFAAAELLSVAEAGCSSDTCLSLSLALRGAVVDFELLLEESQLDKKPLPDLGRF